MPYIDVKSTIWRRYLVPDDLDPIKSAKNFEYTDFDSELLFDTEEEMCTGENDNQPTLEVYSDKDSVLLWSNEPLDIKRENSINSIIKQ